jgi:hypothetical protein
MSTTSSSKRSLIAHRPILQLLCAGFHQPPALYNLGRLYTLPVRYFNYSVVMSKYTERFVVCQVFHTTDVENESSGTFYVARTC